jgi:chaperonin cofactor prefoldin
MAVSWADFFYDNPDRKKRVIAGLQTLYDAMKDNFRATNKFINFWNKNHPNKLERIIFDDRKTFKENGELLTKRMDEIKKEEEKLDDQLKKELDPDLYKMLQDADFGSYERHLKTYFTAARVGLSTIAGGVVLCLVSKALTKTFQKAMSEMTTRIFFSTFAGVAAGAIFGTAIDIVIGAIFGACERAKLEKFLKEMDEVLAKFLPLSEDYKDSIDQILATVKVYENQ